MSELPAGADVVVVGAGVTGLSAAWRLAQAGVSVVVLDKGVVGWEASGRNGGGASHYHSPLFHEEQRAWPHLDEELGYATEYRRERVIFATTEHHLGHYRHMAEICRGLGYQVDDLDPAQVREFVHPRRGQRDRGHPPALRRTGQSAAHRAGLRLGPDGPRRPDLPAHAGDGHRRLRAAKSSRWRRRGAASPAITWWSPRGRRPGCCWSAWASRLPLGFARAEMIVTEPAPLMPVGGADGNGLYGRQTLRGNLAYGGGPHEWMDVDETGPRVRPSTPLLRNLAKRVAELLPKAAHLRVIRSWAGVVENTPDGRPVIDRLDDPGNLTVATMSGVGFGLSPASGRAVRDLVLDGRCSFADIDKLSIRRFADIEAGLAGEPEAGVPTTHAEGLAALAS